MALCQFLGAPRWVRLDVFIAPGEGPPISSLSWALSSRPSQLDRTKGPPVHVEAAFTELDLTAAWIGMGNREQLTIPVLRLRESAQRMGLLRKHRGRLMVTARGKAARSDPSALWFQLAERMPLTSKDLCEEQAGLLFLIAVAAGENDPDGFVADMLDAIGWKHRDRTRITTSSATHITRNTRDVLRRLRLLAPDSRVAKPERVTPQAVAFARAAVRSWPSAAKSTPRS
jgi:predicted DNA-binding transcriptional regulator AlpA